MFLSRREVELNARATKSERGTSVDSLPRIVRRETGKTPRTTFFRSRERGALSAAARISARGCRFIPVEARGSKSRVRLQGVTLVRILEPPYRRHSASCTHARRKSTLAVSRRSASYICTCLHSKIVEACTGGRADGRIGVRVSTRERDWRRARV